MTETKGQCPSHSGDTGGSDSYSWNSEKNQGSCFSCGLSTWLHQDTGELWGKRDGRKFKIADVGCRSEGEPPVLDTDELFEEDAFVSPPAGRNEGEFKALRGITKETMEHWGVKTYGDTKQVYVYPSGGTKTRYLKDKSFSTEHFKSDELFGMNMFPSGCSKMVTITEGELDAMSAWQMLKSGNYINPVVSLPSATPAGKLWEKCKSWLDSFEKIILSADNDDPGRKVAETLFDLYPGKVYLMDHGTYKDANDFLMNGDAQAYKSAWWSAKKYSPAGFTASVEDWLTCLSDEEPYKYVPTPFEDYNKVARGLVKGGITILKAPPGSGKSSLLRCLQHDQVTKRGCKVAVLMMEEVKSITGRAMASYQLGKNVMTKEDAVWAGISEEDVKEALKEVVGNEKFISFDVNPQDPIKDTLRQCKQAVAFYDVDYIYIDHLQRLAYLSGTEGATSALTELAVQLTEFAKRKDVGIICISHVNQDGSVKYAKSVEEEAIVVIELERDRQSDDFEERNTAYLTVTKNRPFGTTGSSGALTYDVETTILSEKPKPKEPKVANTQEF